VRKLLVLALALAGAGLAVLAATALAATRNVTVGDNYFVRSRGVPTVHADRRDRIRWRFVGDRPHNVKVTRGPVRFTSPTKTSGTFTYPPRGRRLRRGTYRIVCTIHGARDMSMRLVVD
jgi:plastocyanin